MTSRLEHFVTQEREAQEAHAKRMDGFKKTRDHDDQVGLRHAVAKGKDRQDKEAKVRAPFRHRNR